MLQRLVQSGRVVEGGFRPGGMHREWCDDEVLRAIRRKSLARLRKEVEPVEQRTLARLFTRWQGVVQPRRGLDALLDVIENLQGAPLPASILETEILPARLVGYKPADLDTVDCGGRGGVGGVGADWRARWADRALSGGEAVCCCGRLLRRRRSSGSRGTTGTSGSWSCDVSKETAIVEYLKGAWGFVFSGFA